MTSRPEPRRRVLLWLLRAGPCAWLLAACARSAPKRCDDLRGLSDAAQMGRALQQYTDRAWSPEQRCELCDFWQAAPEVSRCGACRVVPGPIHPKGSCVAFVAKR